MKINLLKTAVVGGSAYYAYQKNVNKSNQIPLTVATGIGTYVAYTAVQVAISMTAGYIALKSAEAVLKGAANALDEELNKAEEAIASEA